MKKIASLFLIISILTLFFASSLFVFNINAENESKTEITQTAYKVAMGNYIGNDFSPCSLTFDFVPVIVIVYAEGKEPTERAAQELVNGSYVEAGWNNGFVWRGEKEILVSVSDPIEIDDHYAGVTFNLYGNILVWEGISDFAQNVKGITYNYIAIGY